MCGAELHSLPEGVQRVAQALQALDYPVRAWTRSPHPQAAVPLMVGREALGDFVSGCAVLVNLLPLTPDTEGLLDHALLSRLPRGAMLVNVARGAHLVDEDLLALLDSGHIARAWLDVFRQEPLPAAHRFWRHPSVHLTPHTSARTLRGPSVAQIAQAIAAIERGGQYLLSYGITSCMEAAAGMRAGFREIAAYHKAKRDGRLPVRTWLALLGDPGKSIVPQCVEAGLVAGTGDEMLSVGGVKYFLDGSAGGRTAWMSEPYLNEPDNTGVKMLEDHEIEALCLEAHRHGFQLVCHAIGDAAIGQLITAYEKALAAHPDPDRRHRIEHCGFSTEAQHKRMVAAGIYPCPQQVFIHDFGDAYVAALGPEKAKPSYPFRTWFDLGLKPATGSDAPVCDPDPFPNFHAMLTRQTWRGTVMDARQCVSIEEALQAYTEFGAFSQKEEHRKGRLVPGMLADVAVFSRNLLEATPAEIWKDTRCDLTILGGKVVFERPAG